jgi:hypothetical protein
MLDLGPKKHVRSMSLIGYRLWHTVGVGNLLQKSIYNQKLCRVVCV